MDDKAPQENPKKDFNKLDLNQLQDFSFGTQWTQDKSSPSDKQSSDRRPRGDDRAAPRRDRRGFRKPEGGGDRRDRGGADRRPRRDAQGGGNRGEGNYAGRGAPQFQGPYDSPYFTTSFYPEDNSFDALAKTIRASCRTIELFEIAKTVVQKEDRFIVVLTRRGKDGGKDKTPLYVSVPDGMPFESEDEVINHVMANHLDRFFTTEEVEVDAPTGNFQVINKCGITGALLGPPNYHRYNQFVQQHFATQIKGMSLEAFRNRIESVRDPEVVSQWTEQMKKVTRFTWKTDEASTPAKKEASAPETKAEVAPSAPADAAPAETVTDDVATPETVPVAVSAETNADESAPAAEEVKVDEAVAEPAAATPAGLTFDTIEDARLHLIGNARQQIVRSMETVRFHGRLLETMPDSEIRRAVRGALERQRHFPLDTANGLRGRLRREHFTIFKKGAKGISYVCAVKRKFRVPGQTFADSIGELISFIENNPMIKVSELTSKFVGIETPTGEVKEGETAPEVTITDAQKAKFTSMQRDLRWLVMEGYVTEFIDGRLFAAPPIPESKKKAAEDTDHDTESYPEKSVETAAAQSKPAAAEKTERAVDETPVMATPAAPEQVSDPTAVTTESEPARPKEEAPPASETSSESTPVETEAKPEEKPESVVPPVNESAAPAEEEKKTPPPAAD